MPDLDPTPPPAGGPWGLPRSFWGLWSAQLINRVASFAQPFLVLYLTRDHHVDLPTAGAITSGVGVGSIVATLAGGWAADHAGRRATMLTGQVLTAAALVWLALTHGLWQLWVSAVLVGLGGDLVRPAMNTSVSDIVPADRHVRAYGLLFWAVNLGFALATVGGGWMTRWGYPLLFLVNAAASALAAAIIWRSVPESRPAPQARRPAFLPVLRRDLGTVTLLCVGIVYSVVYFQAYSTLPLVMAGQGISPAAYGVVLAVNGVVVCLVQPFAVRVMERFRPELSYAVGLAVLGLGFGMTSLAAQPWQHALVVTVWTLGEIAVAGVVAAIFAARAPEGLRGRYLGLASLPFAIGAAVGPALGTAVLARTNATTVWLGCGAACLIAALVLRAMDSTARATSPQTERKASHAS